jgi:hypothetical protein
MKTIYKTESGQEFEDMNKALAFEKLEREKISISRGYVEKEVISPKCLKQIFNIGDIYDMTLLLKDEEGRIYEDSCFEVWLLDETGHLDCSDYNHGIIGWSEKDNTYYYTRHFVSHKVELVGIVSVIYA